MTGVVVVVVDGAVVVVVVDGAIGADVLSAAGFLAWRWRA